MRYYFETYDMKLKYGNGYHKALSVIFGQTREVRIDNPVFVISDLNLCDKLIYLSVSNDLFMRNILIQQLVYTAHFPGFYSVASQFWYTAKYRRRNRNCHYFLCRQQKGGGMEMFMQRVSKICNFQNHYIKIASYCVLAFLSTYFIDNMFKVDQSHYPISNSIFSVFYFHWYIFII